MALIDSLGNTWKDLYNADVYEQVTCSKIDGSVAKAVLDTFGINISSDISGGRLDNIDIARMDAFAAMKLSLLQNGAETGVLTEAIVEDNAVSFKQVGAYSAGVDDIYYSIQSGTYQENCAGVIVTGGKPLSTFGTMEWKEIWGEGDNSSKVIFDTHFIDNLCNIADLKASSTIVFNDPHLDTKFEDGIDNLYEISATENTHKRILGYVYYSNLDELPISDDTTIDYVEQCRVPINIQSSGKGNNPNNDIDSGLPVLGKLLTRTAISESVSDAEYTCLNKVDISDMVPEYGVELNIPEKLRYTSVRKSVDNNQIDKLVGISDIYCKCFEISLCQGLPLDPAGSLLKTDFTTSDYVISAVIDNTNTVIYRLNKEEHYTVVYKDAEQGDAKKVYIVFADNSIYGDVAEYGEGITFYIEPNCAWYESMKNFTGGNYNAETHTLHYEDQVILPVGDGKALWVQEIYVVLDLATHAISITDPTYGKADEIAQGLIYAVSPIWLDEPPAPVAYNGQLIDLIEDYADNDPTTQQDLDASDYDRVLDEMDAGGGMSLSLSFLDEDGVVRLSEALREYMGNRTILETTYVCGPRCDIKIGGYGPSGGIINNVTYSYVDSGSYTISANEGPYLVEGISDFNGGPSVKQVEEQSARGTVVASLGTNTHFKVRVDGYGECIALNCYPGIIRVGDKVSVSIHNNPIEV